MPLAATAALAVALAVAADRKRVELEFPAKEMLVAIEALQVRGLPPAAAVALAQLAAMELRVFRVATAALV